MNEVRQAWTSLRSPSRASNFAASNGTASTATWYDVPAPVIVHCRDFREEPDANRRNGERMSNENKGTNKEEKEDARKSVDAQEEEVLYQNNVEAALNSLSKVCTDTPSAAIDLEDVNGAQRDEGGAERKRLSSTVELKATSSVKTDGEGVPTISFSFLRADDKPKRSALDETEATMVDAGDQTASQDRLYDLPRNSRASDDVPDSSGTNDNGDGARNRSDNEEKTESAIVSDLYDVPRATERCENDDGKLIPAGVLTVINLPSRKHRVDVAKRSTRSLKSGRRSCATESDAYDAGIASMSGSYSDPECPNGTLSGGSRNGASLKLQKRRLGKAWGKMRSWLREERTKIGEVVNRHARMQAVGASRGEPRDDDPVRISGPRSASYDLTKARAQELGSITRVEEFGLSSVVEEEGNGNVAEVERPCSGSPDSRTVPSPEGGNDERLAANRSLLRARTASSDDILGNGARPRLHPVSFSMDKLCSDAENDDAAESEPREHAGKGGLIKRRMLGSIRGLMASTHLLQASEIDEGGQGGFEDVRRYVKQGGDFCKELAAILHERAELEATYAKGLSKLSSKLTKACAKDQGGNSTGGVNEAWRCVGEEMEAAAEAHRVWGIALGEQLAKPLRVGVAEAQGRSRKSIENSVDKASKSLQEWRGVAAKSKKQSFACARENERLQDLARLQSISQTQQNNNKSSAHHHMTEKEASKLEARRRKAEDSSRRADTEFYTVSVRAERARLEYESTVRKGAKQMELLEEERLSALKDLANVYLAHLQALAPRLQQSADRLMPPIRNCNVSQDVEILKNLIRRIDSNDAANAEQLLPDFYAEHVTLAMNRERRKQALVRVLHLIRQDLEREKRGREGLETLHRAFIKTPAFAADESTQNVTDKLHHMRSMLMYLEAARYKVGGTLAEVEGSKRNDHPLAEHILVSRDKQGLQQSVLKIPSWAKNESLEFQDTDTELDEHLSKDHETESRDWADRTAGDGNSENPPDEDDFSDFDEFSSHSEDNNNQDVDVVDVTAKSEGAEQCRAIYQYSANLNDELSLNPGDLITVHRKQADGWWIGECRGRTGIFPATYVQVIH